MHKDQAGFASILLVALGLLVAAGIGVAAYKTYEVSTSRQPKEPANNPIRTQSTDQTYLGNVAKVDCTKVEALSCTPYILQDGSDKSYNLAGQNLDKYVDKTVKVAGQVSQNQNPPPTETIKVASIETISGGILKGRVTCNEKADPVPCSASIEIQPINTDQPNQTITVDNTGRFSISLPPDAYELKPASKPGYPMFMPQFPNPVTITNGQTTEVTISYHSGLR